MLVAFVHTDNLKRLLPYHTIAARDAICEQYTTRVASASVVDLSSFNAAVVSRAGPFSLPAVIQAAAVEDILLLGGLTLFRYAMPYVGKLYWYRSRIDDANCPLWHSFSLYDWHIDRVTPDGVGVLTELTRRSYDDE